MNKRGLSRGCFERAASVRPQVDWNFPGFDLMHQSQCANHGPSPSTRAMRIEPVSVSDF